jgi:hypothetical protein
MDVSEQVEKYLKEKAEEIKKGAIEHINSEAKNAVQRLEKIIEQLREQAKIVLPINVLEILTNGGYIYSKKFEYKYPDGRVSCDIFVDGARAFEFDWDTRPLLKKGTYRITLIIEKLKEE